MSSKSPLLADMTARSREVFQRIVEEYLATGEPVGSRTLTRSLSEQVSAATVRNVMQDLEYLGLLDSPHVSAGRMPTEIGLRLFVDGILEIDDLNAEDRDRLEASVSTNDADITHMLDRVSSALSGLTHGASIVLSPKQEAPIKHIEFVSLGPDQALVVLVFENGDVENRLFRPAPGHTPSAMREAANFLNAALQGKTLTQLKRDISGYLNERQKELDQLARELVKDGLAVWHGGEGVADRLIVRGRSNLLDEATATEDLARFKSLFDDLEAKRDIVDFLQAAEDAEGVRIFIGSENRLFSLSGSSLVVSPYMNADRKVIGAVGVIGPTRLNYGRIVPIVDYTAQLVGKMLSDRA